MKDIKTIAVLGSGTMGSALACHFANAGFEVLLLDMLPGDLEAGEDDPAKRNALADRSLKQAAQSKPAPLFKDEFVDRIRTGNFEDHLPDIEQCEWIIEAIVEDLEIKRDLFKRVEKHRTSGSLVSTNTSGIPIHQIAEGFSGDFRTHFLGTHFFNPPRYLRLLEIIPTEDTGEEVIDFFLDFGERFLGKETVRCKDSPAFIGNRIGVFAMAKIFQLTGELDLPISAVDKLTGPALARPKTGTFRLADMVGLDVAAKVIKGIRDNCPEDDQMQALGIPDYLEYLLENEWYGQKSDRGFYIKTEEKDERGKSIIKELDLSEQEYIVKPSVDLDSLNTSKQIEHDKKRIRTLFEKEDAGGQLIRRSLASLFAYISHRIPEITGAPYLIDRAMKAGFGWQFGPFEYWDIIGLEKGIRAAEDEGVKPAAWVYEMKEEGFDSFYRLNENSLGCYQPEHNTYEEVPGIRKRLHLDLYRQREAVFSNDETVLHDLDDGVLCLEFRSEQNAIGEGILRGITRAIDIAEEEDWKGLVITNDSRHFTVGANLMLIGMMAFEQEWDDLAMAVKLFQDASMRIRYSSIPVVIATKGYVFGGGCEFAMHSDCVIASAESYIGLVEAGVGLIPGGGGSKEFARRISESFGPNDTKIPKLVDYFKTIAMGEVSTSAEEAFDLHYLSRTKDLVEMNEDLRNRRARDKVLELAKTYRPPIRNRTFEVLGRQGLASLYVSANELYRGNYATEHDITIAKKLAWVICGGDLTGAQEVSPEYLLELEREAFLSLCGEQKTLERIQHMLEYNKPLRN